jgi:hypothetical protein
MKSTNPANLYAWQDRDALRGGTYRRGRAISDKPAQPVEFSDIEAAYREAAEFSRKDEEDNDRDG